MPTPIEEKPAAELRDYLAEERTFLAWIRTGLTLMGFGFVVARFGIFLEVIQVTRGELGPRQHVFSRWVGTGFIGVAIVICLLSTRRRLRIIGELNRGQAAGTASQQGIMLALFLALVGLAMALYLSLA
jgi:inner membrane protein YidH